MSGLHYRWQNPQIRHPISAQLDHRGMSQVCRRAALSAMCAERETNRDADRLDIVRQQHDEGSRSFMRHNVLSLQSKHGSGRSRDRCSICRSARSAAAKTSFDV